MEFLVDSSLRASLPYNSFFAPIDVREDDSSLKAQSDDILRDYSRLN